ncbi:hypothetical protein BJ741DRAFT_602264 [Chytriomyces cf. hyalinus JEL632]|nr:hypothetical protein BJ741DRAFT_602264 [Chytriomyces cf. hyalinus JEL632]
MEIFPLLVCREPCVCVCDDDVVLFLSFFLSGFFFSLSTVFLHLLTMPIRPFVFLGMSLPPSEKTSSSFFSFLPFSYFRLLLCFIFGFFMQPIK